MACSKLQVDCDTVCTRINRVHGPPLQTLISGEEIELMCSVIKHRAVSIELIHHMLGGPNMDYHCIENNESFEAFDYLRNKLIKDLTENKMDILFFEDRKCVSSNIIVVVVMKKAKHGSREHIVMKTLIRMTVNVEPKIGYCRFFDLTGNNKFSFTVYKVIIK